VPPLQQPFGHVVASQEQAPVVVSHTAFGQLAQAAPPVPHCEADCDACATHTFPLQQPPGHEDALQTHCPVLVLHAWPEAQPAQLAPAVPHEVLVWEAHASHVPLVVQQPLGHEVALHPHCPVLVLQAWPDAHALHVAPPAPHEPFDSLDGASHVPPAVQQPEHDAPAHPHDPLAQDSPLAHALHAAPPAPHCEPVCEAYTRHALPLQQPPGHEVALHTHVPVVAPHA
jgi:hypothetical protein